MQQNEKAENDCPWDMERFKLVASTPEEEQALLAMLLRHGEQELAVMEKSTGDDKVVQWRKAAHSLRGAAANLGMERLALYCREDEASTASAEKRTRLMDAIREELKRIAYYKDLQAPK